MNNLSRKLEELNAQLVNVVTFWIGVTLTIVGVTVVSINTDLQVIFISVGASLIASSVIVFISSKYLIRQSRIKDIIEIWGLENIFRTRAEMNISSNKHLEEIEASLDIVAFGLRSFRDNKSDLIANKVKKGLKIRILTINPNSIFLVQREKDEKDVRGHMRNTIIQLSKWIDWLNAQGVSENQVQIKYYDTLPLDFYFRSDDSLYIGPYIYGKTSQQTISYEFRVNSRGYDYWKSYFDSLWNDTDFARKDYNSF